MIISGDTISPSGDVVRIENLESNSLVIPDGSVSNPSIKFETDTDTGIYKIGSNEIGVVTGGVLEAKIGTYGLHSSGLMIQSIYSENDYVNATTGVTYTDILSAVGVSWEIPITPKFNNSVIQLNALFQARIGRATTVGAYGGMSVQRKIGSGAYATIFTPVSDATGPYTFGINLATQLQNIIGITIQDSPATTETVTYKFQYRVYTSTTNATTLTINENVTTKGKSFCFLREIGV